MLLIRETKLKDEIKRRGGIIKNRKNEKNKLNQVLRIASENLK